MKKLPILLVRCVLQLPHLFFLFLIGLTLAGWIVPPPRLRIGVHTIRPHAESLARAADLGVDTVVQLFPWREIEPTRDQFYWQQADETVAGAGYYGLDLIVRLDQPPDWAIVEPRAAGKPPIDLDAYGRYVHAVASRYRGRVKGYILWNEPNLALEWMGLPPDPAVYVDLLRTGYQAIAEGDPTALVISAGLAPTNTMNETATDDRHFLAGMYRHGAAGFFHVLGAHAYGFGLPPDAPFVDPAASDSDLAGLVFQRVAELRGIMEAHGDGDKPVYITEMGWTVDGVAHSAWQAVTPTEQAGYLLDAFAIARRDWPWLELITVWNLGGEENPAWRGYSLLDAEGRPRPAYTALQGFLQSADWASQRETRQEPQPLDRYQVLAEDVTIHLGDAEMPLPWAPLHAGRNPSPHWEGTVYVVEPGQADWQLTLRIMQSNGWSNRIWINGEPLPEPLPVHDFSKSWVAHTWTVPARLLRPGPNRIGITAAHATPLIQATRFAYDELQIKDVVLWR